MESDIKFQDEVFTEHESNKYLPVSVIIKQQRNWIGHLHEIRQQMIAEYHCEDNLYYIDRKELEK